MTCLYHMAPCETCGGPLRFVTNGMGRLLEICDQCHPKTRGPAMEKIVVPHAELPAYLTRTRGEMKQVDFAKKIGTHPVTLNQVELGKRKVGPFLCDAIEKALGIVIENRPLTPRETQRGIVKSSAKVEPVVRPRATRKPSAPVLIDSEDLETCDPVKRATVGHRHTLAEEATKVRSVVDQVNANYLKTGGEFSIPEGKIDLPANTQAPQSLSLFEHTIRMLELRRDRLNMAIDLLRDIAGWDKRAA